MIENDPYYNQANHKIKPKKKKKWIIISLSIIILIILGFLAWVYVITPELQQAYIQGQESVIIAQTENEVIAYVGQDGKINIDPLAQFCQTFYGDQQ